MAEYARVIDGTILQTPVHHYVHPAAERQVTLIGTVHVGEPGYYQNLRDLVEQRESDGAVVHCEGARLRTAGPKDLTPDETHLLRELGRLKEMEEAAITALGWAGQVRGLGYPARWQIVDMTLIEIIRAVGPDVFLRQARRVVRVLEKYEGDPARALAWFRAQAAIALRGAASGKLTRRARGDAVIVDRRTEVALSGVDSVDCDMVVIWGAAHLPGLDVGLRQRGFTRVATDWHDVMQLPTLGTAIWHAMRSGNRRAQPEPVAIPMHSQTRPAHTTRMPQESTSSRPSRPPDQR